MHGIERMAFSGQKPWHWGSTNSVELPADAPRDVMQKEAGLDWSAQSRELLYSRLAGGVGPFDKVPDRVLLVRSDNFKPLADDPVSNRYRIMQPDDLFDFCDALKDGGALYHTAGSLFGGSKIWVLMQTGDGLDVRHGDTEYPFVLASTSFDGSESSVLGACSVRVVCNNTLQLATTKGSPLQFRIPHVATAEARMKVAFDALRGVQDEFLRNHHENRAFVRQRMNPEAAFEYFTEVLTGKPFREVRELYNTEWTNQKRHNFDENASALLSLFRDGLGNQGDSAWDALNAVTEFIDHQRSRIKTWRSRSDYASDSSLFGEGAKVKARARQLLLRRAA